MPDGKTMTDPLSGSTRSGSSDDMDTCLEYQQTLLEESLPLVFSAYDQAVAERLSDPVVVLLDCEDPLGQEIARGWLGDEAVDSAIEQVAIEQVTLELAAQDDQTTVFAHGFAWDVCHREIPSVFPYLAPIFEQPRPRNGFLAISVTSGGASALTVPWDARKQAR
jgi:hypothetical protein